MHHSSGYINAGPFRLHYLKMGVGRKLLIAFHGYGNDASMFLPFERYLSQNYTIYSFDLPHHGKSRCDSGPAIEKGHLHGVVTALMQEMRVDRVAVMGYSIGGRVALSVVETMPEHIEKVVLIASDGLVFNRFYHFVTNTGVGRRLFRNCLEKPKAYMSLLDWLKKLKIIDQHRHGFASHYLASEPSRTFLLRVWPCLRKLVPDDAKVRKLVKQHAIPIHIYIGQHDRIIPVRLAQRFKANLDSVQLYILDKGHRLLDAETVPQVAAALLSD
jgi:pimeloyl-ACP methyl ester carboxylesterase